jgi:parallel beta-helix repeat protein
MSSALRVVSLSALSAFLLAPLSPALARDWVVAQTRSGADDANLGTEDQPLLTINAAAQKAQHGDVVLVHSGVYRERVAPARGGTEAEPIVYQAVLGESVAVKGSDVWTHWQPVDGQPGVYSAEIAGHLPEGEPNPFAIAVRVDAIDPEPVARPASGAVLPKTLAQVFYDGRPLAELSSESEVPLQQNAWIVSADGKRVLAHFPGDPASLDGHLVEVSVRNRIFAPRTRGLSYIQVKGFLFEHCANQGPFPQGGEVSPRSGKDWLFEGNTIRYAKTIGIDVGSEVWNGNMLTQTAPEQKVKMLGGHDVVQGNLVTDNGLCGIAGWNHGGVVIRNNVVERNNALGFSGSNSKWEEWGGIKLHEGAALIEGNLVRDNDAYGIWLDNNWTGSRITRNVVLNNRQGGVFLELGDGKALIDNNVIAFTRPGTDFYAGAGVYSHDSSGLVIAHNLIVGNADCGVLLRTISGRIFQGQPVHVSHTRILNNIIVNNSRAAIALAYPGEMA